MNLKIIGGGIAGLASALAVANAGGKATVFEKSAKFDSTGAGLQLGPNAARALQSLGAWDAVKPMTYAPPEIHIRDGHNGKILKRSVLGKKFEARYSMPYLTAHRADLHNALLDVAASKSGIKIKTSAEVGDLSYEGFEGVIAADGVWSKTREKLFPDSQVIMAGDTYFRSLISMPKDGSDVNFECVNLWLYHGGHVVHYPVGNPAQLNMIAITSGEEPNIFYKEASEYLQTVLALPAKFSKWQSAYVSPLKQWHKGNITLIGDAAHATLPYLAQGAAMALEDAAELNQLLNTGGDYLKVINSLSEHRANRVKRLHESSINAGKIYHQNRTLALTRNAIIRLVPAKIFQSQLNWIYDHER